MPTLEFRPNHVFVNVPYDRLYEPTFITLIGTLIFLGQTPHCVIEISDTGQGRLLRLYELMKSCGVSIHDLSRQGKPARFNMPFELGLAYSFKLNRPSYKIFVMDKEEHRLLRTLSDYQGRDILIHDNRCDMLITRLLGLYQVTNEPTPNLLRSEMKEIRKISRILKRRYRVNTIFEPTPFRVLVGIIVERAVTRGCIQR